MNFQRGRRAIKTLISNQVVGSNIVSISKEGRYGFQGGDRSEKIRKRYLASGFGKRSS